MVSTAHDLHPNDHSIEASVEEKGDSSIPGDPAMTAEDSDSNLFDKSVTLGASLARMGDAKEDDDDGDNDDYVGDNISVEDFVATTQIPNINSDCYDCECRFKCLGCTEPENLYNQPAEDSPFFDYPSDEERSEVTMEELLEVVDSITLEQYNEAVLACRRSLERSRLVLY